MECGGRDRRLVVYRNIDQISAYIDDNGTQDSHNWKSSVCYTYGRKLYVMGMELEGRDLMVFNMY